MHSVYSFAFLDICTWIVNIIKSLLRSKNNPSAVSWRVYDSCECTYLKEYTNIIVGQQLCWAEDRVAISFQPEGSLKFRALRWDRTMVRVHRCVSIPYMSGHPFLQNAEWGCGRPCWRCQSPIYRDTHFYQEDGRVDIDLSAVCQSPIYRDTHFYVTIWSSCSWQWYHVSIPYLSGHPFLPSPSKLLDFMRPPSLDFAGIYQTILTKSLFLGF